MLLLVPTIEAGAADESAVELTRILASAGHRPIVASKGGRKAEEIAQAGGEWVALDVATVNPAVMLANVPRLVRLIRGQRCVVVHAHGRAAAWSGLLASRITGCPFITTWHKGFRQQNPWKHLYNGVMVRGDRVIAVSQQVADLIVERYRLAPERITVLGAGVDLRRFSPARVTPACREAVRRQWGVGDGTKIVLVLGRLLRRKGHHVVIEAARRLRALGLKDFACVFAGEDAGTRYAGELWDEVLAHGLAELVRIVGPTDDVPAAYAAASVVVSAAVQEEGLQRALLEAQAMGRPVVASDLAAGGDVVLAPPAVSEDRMTGLRFPAGDDAALAAALVRIFSMTESAREAMGQRGRAWIATNFDPEIVAAQTLALYTEAASGTAAQPAPG